jgi:acyl-coenzyme A synthetase/AMP-(fatty) acid ligase
MAGPGEHAEEDCTGRPLSGVVVEIVDPSQGQCRRGERGEIRLKAPGMANGYLDNLEQTQKRFRDGWFYPGDVGSLAEDGTLFVHGRTDDMMILNGVNIFPAELERALESHPAVKAAAALPISSAVHGQIPVAAVELAVPGSISARELQLFANEHLGLRAPRRILIVPELPRTGQGKLLKRELAKLFAPGGRSG